MKSGEASYTTEELIAIRDAAEEGTEERVILDAIVDRRLADEYAQEAEDY